MEQIDFVYRGEGDEAAAAAVAAAIGAEEKNRLIAKAGKEFFHHLHHSRFVRGRNLGTPAVALRAQERLVQGRD